jgi:AcrR family transcriptional regulator
MRTRKSAESRKLEIIETALLLADDLGPERMSAESIARAIGLSQPGIFRHYPTMQALWLAVAAHIGATMEARWAASSRPSASPSTRLRDLVVSQLELIQSTPAIPAILFSRELHVRNESLRDSLYAILGRFHRQVAELFVAARDAGALRADVSNEDAAFLLVGLVQGLAVRWSISGRRFDLVTEGSRLLDVQLGGFAAAAAPARRRQKK